ncbi:solute carrier family 46 member 2 [Conger conger]|uniref:solute carrier family 46 member 2 n=1 Tax=Conger conger TaxID=82655 RepID=UPI002A5AFB2F|nr:solute carrier family 46 member 2 [Conger conger]
MGGFRTLVEPVVILNTMGSAFYDTALSLSVYQRALELAEGRSDQAQAIASHFLLLYNSLCSLLSFVSTLVLGWLAHRHGPRLLLVLPQVGTVARKSLLLAFVLFRLPLEALYAGAAAYGLCGGTPAYWGALVSLASLTSGERRRSLKINAVDFCYGTTAVLGGLLSGHLYPLGRAGVPLIVMSILLCVGSLLYSAFLLTIPGAAGGGEGNPEPGWLEVSRRAARTDRSGVVLLLVSIAVFDLGMSGAEDVLTLYVQKPPLGWDSVWLGYGSAATNAMYVSSFLGVVLLSRALGDTALILLGVASNCTGMAVMAFATRSWVYFFARGIMMFSCIPMPTIKAQMSVKLDARSYGRVFGWLQATLALTTVLSGLFFTSIYPLTLGWYSGFCFLTSCAISYLSVIPILYLHCRGTRKGYMPISVNS